MKIKTMKEFKVELDEIHTSDMTKAQAAGLRTKNGKNYNGGKYDSPIAQDNPMLVAKVFASIGIIAFLLLA